MQDRINVKERIFNDFKTKIQHLSEIHSVEELLQKSEQFTELQDLLTTLKVLVKYPLEEIENEEVSVEEKLESEELKLENQDLEIEEEKSKDDSQDLEVEQEEIKTEEPITENQEPTKTQESKMKLANIKGLSAHLFDEDALDEMKQEEKIQVEEKIEEPKKQNFKLDLNDKIAFTKTLFDGSQMELNETIQDLNNFDNLEDAKEYLSDLYYKKNWEKVDEYAQRLWTLVENKFH